MSDASEPTKRRARERVGEFEGRRPSTTEVPADAIVDELLLGVPIP